jgi:hypothetical protein
MTPVSTTAPSAFSISAAGRALVDRQSFVFEHSLAGHPLFTLEKLLEVAKSASRRPGDLYFDAGDIRIDQKWGSIPLSELTYVQALKRIETAGAWMIMKHVEEDPAYKEVLDGCTKSVLEAAGPLAALLSKPEMLVIVSSPRRVTPFHMDGECNFLVQVAGSKTVRVFDRDNRAVLTEEEVENFYTVDDFAATYKPDIDRHAQQYELTPGWGVHIPVNFPHWVQNGPEVSVSLSINYEFPESYRADYYRANRMLRNFGWSPAPVGGSRWKDKLKRSLYYALGKPGQSKRES